MIRYISALVVSMFLITPALAMPTLATVINDSYNYITLVKNYDGSSITIPPRSRAYSVLFHTRSTVTNFVNGQPVCYWDLLSSRFESVSALVYNPDNVFRGLQPCVKFIR